MNVWLSLSLALATRFLCCTVRSRVPATVQFSYGVISLQAELQDSTGPPSQFKRNDEKPIIFLPISLTKLLGWFGFFKVGNGKMGLGCVTWVPAKDPPTVHPIHYFAYGHWLGVD